MQTYTIIRTSHRSNSSFELIGSLEELIKYFSDILECGASHSSKKGNSKINLTPKTIKSLISNINKAVNNSAENGHAGVSYTLKEF